MSPLRAKCPTCETLTAVAVGDEYECHSCGRTFAAGLVRVPRAWGNGGREMIESASLPLDYPEAAVIEEDGGPLSYWALQHPPGNPDFHHPDGFALELRNT